MLLCVTVVLLKKSRKLTDKAELTLNNIQPALSWSRTCPNRDWLLSCFVFFPLLPTVCNPAALYLPLLWTM